ncbi:MAG TPA: efflux RND transporter periplasmic adaptor subunit [Desulfomonilaceae bacterium]|nr:efflux RND transporter periplasmic adaptor subunit [Desulfomonilaceae bacterium]
MRCALRVLVCTTLLFLSACGKEEPAVTLRPPVVEVAKVVEKDVPIVHEWVGTTIGLVNATIRAQVTGYLIKQDYKEGDLIKTGEVLFEIDPRPFQAILDQAKGTLVQMQARYRDAHANLLRQKPLFEQGAISKQSLDSYVAADQAAEGQVLSAKAAVEKAELDLGFTKITSPIDGVAGIAKAQVGDLVGPAVQGGELATVSTINPIKVKFAVNEQAYIDFMRRYSSEFTTGLEQARKLRMELILADGSGYPYKGKFYAIGRHVDVRTGTIQVEALFPNPADFLRPGQFVRVHVFIATKRGALLVPQRAVNELQGGYQVAVVGTENKVDIRNVKPGGRYGSLWEIEDGLKPGERVVAEGIEQVKQGMLVNPKPFAPASNAAAPEASPKPEHPPATAGR